MPILTFTLKGDELKHHTVNLHKPLKKTKLYAQFKGGRDQPSQPTAIIIKVFPGGPAATAGLEEGDVILLVNGFSGLSNVEVVDKLQEETGHIRLVVSRRIPRMP